MAVVLKDKLDFGGGTEGVVFDLWLRYGKGRLTAKRAALAGEAFNRAMPEMANGIGLGEDVDVLCKAILVRREAAKKGASTLEVNQAVGRFILRT